MFDNEGLRIECGTCLAAGTTACNDCIVSHLLANDDGPIAFLPAPVSVEVRSSVDPVDRVIELFAAAGLVDDPPVFVEPAAFERGAFDPATAAAPVP